MEKPDIHKFISGESLSIERLNEILPCQLYTTEQNNQEKETTDYKLSPREKEIAQLIKYGLTNKEISKKLGLAYETIKSYRKSLFSKLNINHLSQLLTLEL